MICRHDIIVSGQFSFGGFGGSGDSDSNSGGGGIGGFSGFKLSGPLGQLMRGSSSLNLMNSNFGLGQILGTLMSGSTSGVSGGGPLTQLATAASSQYMNALRSNPLLSSFANVAAGGSQQSGGPPSSSSYAAPPSPSSSHPQFSPNHHSMFQNPMAMFGGAGDSSMYGPPSHPGAGGGYDHHFGGSNVFPQYATPDNYFPNGGHYGGPPSFPPSPYGPPSSSYGPQMPPSMMHHLDRKK
ncbi:hypothetical protein DERP_004600 [Dermatophagoides pteronyssinus]|uniref:Uncharacterized protein n=1 Tax=Dermatophagoides pteronyssinus TaxID=6956 RepID=A0ABQ8JP80_DERPT|nr:hypothetical protein DERP_004600 [Dermatophagoides pteronyssinus]